MKNNSTQDIRLGATIRRLRRERQLSQQVLANMLGISTPYLNLIENNRRNVTLVNPVVFRQRLKVS